MNNKKMMMLQILIIFSFSASVYAGAGASIPGTEGEINVIQSPMEEAKEKKKKQEKEEDEIIRKITAVQIPSSATAHSPVSDISDDRDLFLGVLPDEESSVVEFGRSNSFQGCS